MKDNSELSLMVLGLEKGRNPFPVMDGENDYSGRDFESTFLSHSRSLSHAFFNGVSILNSAFADLELDQCEFGEAHISSSLFVRCNIGGTDFVRAKFVEIVFEGCDFTDGEWRESEFHRVEFRNCKFEHTTINLCSFYSCRFIEGSASGLDYAAVNYNVFSKSLLEGGVSNEAVLSRNFGMQPGRPSSALVNNQDGIALEQVCLSSGTSTTRVFDLVLAIERECLNYQGRLRRLRIEFIANILRVLTTEKRISASSLVYIEQVLAHLGQNLIDEGDLPTILGTLATVRSLLYVRTNEAMSEHVAIEGDATSMSVYYVENYNHEEGELLARTISVLVTGNPNVSRLVSFERGSTIYGIDIGDTICTATAAVAAINLFLSQATITIKKVKSLRREIFGTRPPKRVRRRVARANSVPARMFSGMEPKELIELRRIVHHSGLALVKIDEPAKISLTVRSDDTKETGD